MGAFCLSSPAFSGYRSLETLVFLCASGAKARQQPMSQPLRFQHRWVAVLDVHQGTSVLISLPARRAVGASAIAVLTGSGSNSPRLPISMLGNQPIPNPRVQLGNAATQQFRVPTSMSIDKAWLVVNKAWLVARSPHQGFRSLRPRRRQSPRFPIWGQARSDMHCLDYLAAAPNPAARKAKSNQKGTGKFRRALPRSFDACPQMATSCLSLNGPLLDHLMPVPNHPHGARCLDRLSKRGQASSGVHCLDHLMPVPK